MLPTTKLGVSQESSDNQKAFLGLPFEVRFATAAALKLKSSEATKLKAEDIMDVNESTVVEAFDSLGVSVTFTDTRTTKRPSL